MVGTAKCHFLSSDHMLYFLLAHPTPTGFFSDLVDRKQGAFKKLYDMNSLPRKCSEVPEAKIELIEPQE